MRGYQLLKRVDLTDDEGDVLSIIVESNHVSWKLFSIYRLPGQTDSQGDHSTWWNFVDEQRALDQLDKKVQECIAEGWRQV
jgi:hypothetical protein